MNLMFIFWLDHLVWRSQLTVPAGHLQDLIHFPCSLSTIHRKTLSILNHRVEAEIDTPNHSTRTAKYHPPINGNNGVHEGRHNRPILEARTHNWSEVLQTLASRFTLPPGMSFPARGADRGTRHTSSTNSHTLTKLSPLSRLIRTTKSTIFIAPATVRSNKNFIMKLCRPDWCARGAHFSLSFVLGRTSSRPLMIAPQGEEMSERIQTKEKRDLSENDRRRLESSAREGNPG